MNRKPVVFFPEYINGIKFIYLDKMISYITKIYVDILNRSSPVLHELIKSRATCEITGSLALLQYMPDFRDKFEVSDVDMIFPFTIDFEYLKEFQEILIKCVHHYIDKETSRSYIIDKETSQNGFLIKVNGKKILDISFQQVYNKNIDENTYLKTVYKIDHETLFFDIDKNIYIKFSSYHTVFFKKLQYMYQMYHNIEVYNQEETLKHFEKIRKDFDFLFNVMEREINNRKEEEKKTKVSVEF